MSNDDPIQLLIAATNERRDAEHRTQELLEQILESHREVREALESVDLPGLRRAVEHMEACLSTLVLYIRGESEAEKGKLLEYRERAKEKAFVGDMKVGDIKAEQVVIAGRDSLGDLVQGRPEVEKLVGQIERARAKGKPLDKLLARLAALAPDVAKVLVAVLAKG